MITYIFLRFQNQVLHKKKLIQRYVSLRENMVQTQWKTQLFHNKLFKIYYEIIVPSIEFIVN
jgi:hypothetical protein